LYVLDHGRPMTFWKCHMKNRLEEKRFLENTDISLVDILDAVLEKGVTISGELLISVANVDLVYVDLRLLITSVESL
jgi:gas vesicle structural protein